MLSLTPIFGVFLGTIMISLTLAFKIWVHNMRKLPKPLEIIYSGLRGGLFTAGAYASLLMWDSIIKIGFLGILSYGNIVYHITALILMGILSSLVLIAVVFVAPTLKTIINFSFVIGISIYFFWVNPEALLPDYERIFYEPVLYCLVSVILVEVVFLLTRLIQKKPIFQEKQLWNHSEPFKKKVNKTVLVLLWFCFFVELVLNMEGLSILFWI